MTESIQPTSSDVKALAKSLGFDLVGIAPALKSPETEFLRDWVSRGFAGDMQYIERRLEERVDPQRLLSGAKSVIAVGFVYQAGPRPEPALELGRVARYAGGDDYHDVLLDRLRALEAALEAKAGRTLLSRAYVDTGPVQERVYAMYGGLGWIGKNTCLIHPELGSYLFLGVLISDLELEFDSRQPDHCGTCTACLDACPTGAILEPYWVDARRCISYTTIESREGIPEELRPGQGQHVFGCDICQEVCPWNRRPTETAPEASELRSRIWPREEWVAPQLDWLLGLSLESWREVARKTALKRSKWHGLMRNVLIAAGNSGDRELIPLIEVHAKGDDPLLAEHANWALNELRHSAPRNG